MEMASVRTREPVVMLLMLAGALPLQVAAGPLGQRANVVSSAKDRDQPHRGHEQLRMASVCSSQSRPVELNAVLAALPSLANAIRQREEAPICRRHPGERSLAALLQRNTPHPNQDMLDPAAGDNVGQRLRHEI